MSVVVATLDFQCYPWPTAISYQSRTKHTLIALRGFSDRMCDNNTEEEARGLNCDSSATKACEHDTFVLSWGRVLRGLVCAIAVSLVMLRHIDTGSIDKWMLPVPWRVKVSLTVESVVAVIIMLVCLRGRARWYLGIPFVILNAWSLWGFWRR